MREAAVPALSAVRLIARISWRVDIVPGASLVSPVNLTDSGKARVNRRPLVAETGRANQAQMAIGQRHLLIHPAATARRSARPPFSTTVPSRAAFLRMTVRARGASGRVSAWGRCRRRASRALASWRRNTNIPIPSASQAAEKPARTTRCESRKDSGSTSRATSVASGCASSSALGRASACNPRGGSL